MKSIKKVGWLLTLIILIVMAFAVAQYNLTRAEKYPAILSTVEANVPQVVVPTNDNKAVSQSQTNADNLQKMMGDWKAKKIKYGQWMHFVYNIISGEDSGVALPDGQAMPLSYIQDDWYYVNQDGLVEKGVFRMKDANGNILQQSAYRNSLMINFTFDIRQEDQQPYPLNIDLGYMNRISDAMRLGLEIKRSEEDRKGKPNIVSSYIEELKDPIQLGNSKAPVSAVTVKGYFDKASGDFAQTETIYTLEDGSEVLFERVELVRIDISPDAPAEILTILENVK